MVLSLIVLCVIALSYSSHPVTDECLVKSIDIVEVTSVILTVNYICEDHNDQGFTRTYKCDIGDQACICKVNDGHPINAVMTMYIYKGSSIRKTEPSKFRRIAIVFFTFSGIAGLTTMLAILTFFYDRHLKKKYYAYQSEQRQWDTDFQAQMASLRQRLAEGELV